MSGAGIAERTAGTQRIARRGYAVVFMLFLFQTLNFFDKLVFGLSAVPIMKELQISPKQFGLIGSAFFLLFSATGTLVGLFATSRVRAKWIIVALALIWSAAQLPIFFAGSLTVLVACRILLGAGEGPGLPTALHACYDWFPANRRSVPSAIILQGISAGFLIGGPLLTYVIRGYGWRGAFLFCGLLSLVWLVAWLVIGGTGPYAATREVAADTSRNVPGRMLWLDPTIVGVMIMSFMSYWVVGMAATREVAADTSRNVPGRMLWLDPTIVGVMIMSFMSYWVVGMAATWLPPYLQLGLHYSQVNVGWIITGVFAFQSPLLLAGAWVCQRMQLRGVSPRASLGHFSMVALLISGSALIAAVHADGAAQLVLIALAFAAPSLTTISGPVLLGVVSPPAQRGTLIVVIYSANATAALVSNYVTGAIVEAAGPDAPAGFAMAMTVSGVALLVGAATCLLMIFPERTIGRFAGYNQRSINSREIVS
jgi:MFS family permease